MSGLDSRYGLILRIGLLVVFVAIVLFAVDFRQVLGHFDLPMMWALLAVQPLMLLSFTLCSWRYAFLVRRSHPPVRAAFKAVVLAVGLNAVLPGRVSEVIKATYMRDNANVGLSAGLAAVLIERLADIFIVAIMTLVAVGLLLLDVNVAIIVTAVIAAVVALVLLARADRLMQWMLSWVPHDRLRVFVLRLWGQSSDHVREGRFYTACLMGVLIWGTALAVIGGVLEMSGSISIGLGGLLAVFVATTLGGAVAALPAGLGTYEAAAVLCLTSFGYTADEALALALVMHASQFVLSVPLSFLIMLTERIGISNVLKEVAGAVGGWRSKDLADPLAVRRRSRAE